MAALRERLHALLASLDAALLRRAAGAEGRLVSALAEGADRIAVDAAPRRWRIWALLPMPRALYRRDFLDEGETSSPSTEAFDGYLARAAEVTELALDVSGTESDAAMRVVQYAALGRALVRQVDCLLAVWDGQPARGPGGTATVVAEASALGLAILWVDPTTPGPAREIRGFHAGDLAAPDLRPLDAPSLDAIVARVPGLGGRRGSA